MADQKGASSTSCHCEKEEVTAISESLPSNSAELIFMKNSFVFLQSHMTSVLSIAYGTTVTSTEPDSPESKVAVTVAVPGARSVACPPRYG